MKTKLTVGDGIAVLAVFLMGLFFLLLPFLSADDSLSVRITSEVGMEVYSADESREIEVLSNGYRLIVSIDGEGGVEVTESNCESGVCLNSGRLERAGGVIVCAPAGVRIELIGKEEIDFVVG